MILRIFSFNVVCKLLYDNTKLVWLNAFTPGHSVWLCTMFLVFNHERPQGSKLSVLKRIPGDNVFTRLWIYWPWKICMMKQARTQRVSRILWHRIKYYEKRVSMERLFSLICSKWHVNSDDIVERIEQISVETHRKVNTVSLKGDSSARDVPH